MFIGICLSVHNLVLYVHREYGSFPTDVCMYLGKTSYIYSYITQILVHSQFRNIKIIEAWSNSRCTPAARKIDSSTKV